MDEFECLIVCPYVCSVHSQENCETPEYLFYFQLPRTFQLPDVAIHYGQIYLPPFFEYSNRVSHPRHTFKTSSLPKCHCDSSERNATLFACVAYICVCLYLYERYAFVAHIRSLWKVCISEIIGIQVHGKPSSRYAKVIAKSYCYKYICVKLRTRNIVHSTVH